MVESRSVIATVAAVALLLGTASLAAAKTFSFPHVLETSGRITASQLGGAVIPRGVDLVKGSVPKTLIAIDTELEMSYVGGLPGVPSSGATGADVDLYLYDQATGAAMVSKTGTDVCNPCTYNLGTSSRKQSVRIDDLILAKGGFEGVKLGFGVIIVSGGDPDGFKVEGKITTNTGKGLALSVFGFTPQEISAPAP